MLIPIASESQFRLFGTFNHGQPLNIADYSSSVDAGIRNISTVEFDIASGSYFTSGSQHTALTGSDGMLGFRKPLTRPDHAIIPIMDGPNDIISNFDTVNGGNTGTVHSGADNLQLRFFLGGDNHINAIYQISYLEKDQVIIADVDKPTELANDVGEEGYILIPDNLDKDIKNNLDFFLEKAKIVSGAPERIPNSKE